MPHNYGTLSQTLDALKKEGYTLDFNIQDECVVCTSNNTVLQPDDFEIDRIFRYEGASDPDDASILYAISSKKFDVKGTLVNGYGIYSDPFSDALMAKLQRTPNSYVKRSKANTYNFN